MWYCGPHGLLLDSNIVNDMLNDILLNRFIIVMIYTVCEISHLMHCMIMYRPLLCDKHSFIPFVFLFSAGLLQWAETMLYSESYRHMKPLSGTPTVTVTAVWSQPKREKGRGVFSSSSSALKEKQEERGKLFETQSNHLWLGEVCVRRRWLRSNIWAYIHLKQYKGCL